MTGCGERFLGELRGPEKSGLRAAKLFVMDGLANFKIGEAKQGPPATHCGLPNGAFYLHGAEQSKQSSFNSDCSCTTNPLNPWLMLLQLARHYRRTMRSVPVVACCQSSTSFKRVCSPVIPSCLPCSRVGLAR